MMTTFNFGRSGIAQNPLTSPLFTPPFPPPLKTPPLNPPAFPPLRSPFAWSFLIMSSCKIVQLGLMRETAREGRPLVVFLTKDGPAEADDTIVEAIAEAFPEIDAAKEFALARAWLIANPTRRPTGRGLRRFLFNWFKKERRAAERSAKKRIFSREASADHWSRPDLVPVRLEEGGRS